MLKDVFLDFLVPLKPILVVGKGPSLDRISELDLDSYYSIGINQVHEKLPVDISCFLHGEIIPEDKPVLIPYHPHTGKKPGPLSLRDNAYHFNLNTAEQFYRLTPIVNQDGFTIHALLNILGLLGVRDITTIGVDGGDKYAKLMKTAVPPGIASGKISYDMQWAEIRKIEKSFNMSITPFGKKAGHSLGMALAVNE